MRAGWYGPAAVSYTHLEIANILSDAAILGAQSDFSTAVEQYRAQGMSESEAKKQVFMDLIGQVGWAAAGGALSGAVMGGTVNTARFGARQTGYDAAARQGGENADQTVREDAPKAYAGKSLSSDSGVYRYDFLTALPDMRVTGLPEVTAVRDAAGKVDTGAVVDVYKRQASHGMEKPLKWRRMQRNSTCMIRPTRRSSRFRPTQSGRTRCV